MFLIETERGCSRGCTLLRDAQVDQRRHAHRARRDGARHDSRRRAARGSRRRGRERSPADRVNRRTRSPTAGARWGSRRCAPTGSRHTEGFVAALARVGYRTLTTAMDGTSERVREHARPPRAAQAPRAVRRAREEARHGPAQALPDGRHPGRDRRRRRRVRRVHRGAVAHRPRGPRASRPSARSGTRRSTRAPFAGIDVVDDRLDACAAASAGAPTCARRARGGRGSSTCSRRAARPRGSPSSTRSPRAGPSAPTSGRSRAIERTPRRKLSIALDSP